MAEKIFACRDIQAGATPASIGGAFYGSFNVRPIEKIDPGGAKSPGPADSIQTYGHVEVTVAGEEYDSLLALIGAAESNVIFKTFGAAAALRKITIKNVVFSGSVGEIAVPRRDQAGEVSMWAIRGTAHWGASDTLATMIVAAADA